MTFYLWIVLMSQAAVNRLVAELVREGFKVGPLAGSGKVAWDGELSSLLAVSLAKKVEATEGDSTHGTALNIVKKVIEANKLMHHACIIQQVGGLSTWNMSNIELPKPKPDEPQTALERLTSSKGDEIG
jgi:hypothetical protein